MKFASLMLFLTIAGAALPTSLSAQGTTASPRVVGVLPQGLPEPIVRDPPRRAEVEYGEFLFGAHLLSADQSLSCESCHVPQAGYADTHPRAVGIGGAIGRRRAPPLLNLFHATEFMWDGRASSLQEQIHLPLEAANEMAIDWPAALEHLTDRPETRHILDESGERAVSRDLVIRSLAAYVETLVSADSAFDRYYFGRDDSAISEDAKDGFRLFVRKGRCSGCHQITGTSALLTDGNFHSTGIGFADGKYADEGRYEVTGREEDRGAFKTPTLRNVTLRSYFMHDGSLTSLRAVLDYYNRGGNRGAPNLDGRIQPLYLTKTEIEQMLAFLGTLNAEVVSYRPWLKSVAGRP